MSALLKLIKKSIYQHVPLLVCAIFALAVGGDSLGVSYNGDNVESLGVCASSLAPRAIRACAARNRSGSLSGVSSDAALDVSADGVLLWVGCNGDPDLSLQGVRVLLLDHSNEFGGAEAMSRPVEMYANLSKVPIGYSLAPPDWWDAANLSYVSHRSVVSADGSAVEASNSLRDFAAWALAPSALSSLYDRGMLQPLDKLLSFVPALSSLWQDVPQVFRNAAAVYDGHVVGIPYSAEVPLLFWRKDVFQQMGLKVPDSWEEALAVAARLNGTEKPCLRSNSSTSTCRLYGFCFGLPNGCFYDGLTLTAIWASMVGSYGTKAGLYFTPTDMQPLFTGAAMAEAIRIFDQLWALGSPRPRNCSRPALDSYLQHCALGLGLATAFKTVHSFLGPSVRGRLGTSLLPGSHLVQSRASGKLEPCTPALCPYGTTIKSAVHNGTVMISRVPYLGRGAFSLGLNRLAPPNHALAALRALAFTLTYQDGWSLSLDPGLESLSVRSSHLSPDSISRWTAAGYDAADTLGLLQVVRESTTHPCLALGLRASGSRELARALSQVAVEAGVTPVPQLLQLLTDRFNQMVLDTYGGDLSSLQRAYWRDINYAPPAPPGPEMGPSQQDQSGEQANANVGGGGGGGGFSTGAILAIAVTSAVCLVVATAVAAVLTIRREQLLARSGGSQVVPAPSYSPDTSLCITDIQSSTTLWEQLPPAVMDCALSAHNDCVRGLLTRHLGYECHTEGDSFVCAFPTAAAAVGFALELQVALMHVSWPPELLTHPEGAAVYHSATAGPGGEGAGGPSGAASHHSRNPSAVLQYTHPLAQLAQWHARSSSQAALQVPGGGLGSGGGGSGGGLQERCVLAESVTKSAPTGGLAPPSEAGLGADAGADAGAGAGAGAASEAVPERGPRAQASVSERALSDWSCAGLPSSPFSASKPMDAAPAAEPHPSEEAAPGEAHSHRAQLHATSLLSLPLQLHLREAAGPGPGEPTDRGGGCGGCGRIGRIAEDGSSAAGADASETAFGNRANVTADASVSTGGSALASAGVATAPMTGGCKERTVQTMSSSLSAATTGPLGTMAPAAAGPQAAPGPGASAPSGRVLVFRGFRVRVGICSGLTPGRDLVYCKDLSRRTAYSGACMQLTKLISDAALGGMVLLGASTLERLLPLPRRDMPGLVVWHKGCFQLLGRERDESRDATGLQPASHSQLQPIRSGPSSCRTCQLPSSSITFSGPSISLEAPQALYQAMPCSLLPRQYLLERRALRNLGQVLPGLLAAPMGCVTLALVQVVGLGTLMAWDSKVTREALDMLYSTALAQLRAAGGYPAEIQAEGGRLLAAFHSAPTAIRWLLLLEEELRSATPWPPSLLSHELGEEVKVTVHPLVAQYMVTGPLGQPKGASRTVASRRRQWQALAASSPRGSERIAGSGGSLVQVQAGSVAAGPAGAVVSGASSYRQRAADSAGHAVVFGRALEAACSRLHVRVGRPRYRGGADAPSFVRRSVSDTGFFVDSPSRRPCTLPVPAEVEMDQDLGSCSGSGLTSPALPTATTRCSPRSMPLPLSPPSVRDLLPAVATSSLVAGSAVAAAYPRTAEGNRGSGAAGTGSDGSAAVGFGGGVSAVLNGDGEGGESGSGPSSAAALTPLAAPSRQRWKARFNLDLAGFVTHSAPLVTLGFRMRPRSRGAAARSSQVVPAATTTATPLPSLSTSATSILHATALRELLARVGLGPQAPTPVGRPVPAASPVSTASSAHGHETGVSGGASLGDYLHRVNTEVARPGQGQVAEAAELDAEALLEAEAAAEATMDAVADGLPLPPPSRQGSPRGEAALEDTEEGPSIGRSSSLSTGRPQRDGLAGPVSALQGGAGAVERTTPAHLFPPPGRQQRSLQQQLLQQHEMQHQMQGQTSTKQQLDEGPGQKHAHSGFDGARESPEQNRDDPRATHPRQQRPWRRARHHLPIPTRLFSSQPTETFITAHSPGSEGSLSPLGPTPLVQRRVLRGLRVRCAVIEGSFYHDGSVSAARLYRGQHGGRPYSRLERLCDGGPIGQVVCSPAVAKRVQRAAAAADPAAQQLQLMPLSSFTALATAPPAAAAAEVAPGLSTRSPPPTVPASSGSRLALTEPGPEAEAQASDSAAAAAAGQSWHVAEGEESVAAMAEASGKASNSRTAGESELEHGLQLLSASSKTTNAAWVCSWSRPVAQFAVPLREPSC